MAKDHEFGDFEDSTKAELEAEAKAKGLDATGTKAELIKRLAKADKAEPDEPEVDRFGNPVVPEPVPVDYDRTGAPIFEEPDE
jgi:hypothetical protein